MNMHAALQTLFASPEPMQGRPPAAGAARAEQIELELDLELDDEESLRGPESWREIADTLSDPVEPA